MVVTVHKAATSDALSFDIIKPDPELNPNLYDDPQKASIATNVEYSIFLDLAWQKLNHSRVFFSRAQYRYSFIKYVPTEPKDKRSQHF